jgi:hypothetical protein
VKSCRFVGVRLVIQRLSTLNGRCAMMRGMLENVKRPLERKHSHGKDRSILVPIELVRIACW